MKQVVQQQRTGHLKVVEVPAPALRPEGVLVRSVYSLISAGTERAKVAVARKNLIGKALARPDQVRQVLQTYRQIGLAATYQKVTSKLDALSPLGYSSAGVVIAAGERAGGLRVGDRVACAGGGYANHAELAYVPHTLCAKAPEGVRLDEAAFATLGAIALQGVRQAEPRLGEAVGVIGLGLLGLLTVQLLKANGCRVVGLDLNASRCELARQLGADAAADPGDPALEALACRFSPGGLDAVILTAATSSSEPVRLAGRLARQRARVVAVGAVGMQVPRTPFYEKELDLRLSRSYGPGRYDPQYEEQGRDYPIGYVRWTEGRNLAAVLDLLAQGKLDVKRLATHRFPIEEAEQAYALIENKTGEPYLGVLLEYPHSEPGLTSLSAAPLSCQQPIAVQPYKNGPGQVGIALIGAGSFAQSMLLPHLKGHPSARLRLVVTPGGLTARSVAERSRFELCASGAEAAFNDSEVRLAVIASRHDSHAELARRALKAGKAVFVEKPLALTREELQGVVEAYHETEIENPNPEIKNPKFLMVGFNRRFAPLVAALKEFLVGVSEPLLMHYRVNAGFIPKEHWTQDMEQGGGRVLGEVCHFVDLLYYLAGSPPVEVSACALPDLGRYTGDNLAATLRFANGTVGTISYAANGDRGLEKERLEVFGGGRAAVLEDFRRLVLAAGGRKTVKKSRADKGHRAEMLALMEAVQGGQPEPIPFAQCVQVTLATFGIWEALRSGQPASLE